MALITIMPLFLQRSGGFTTGQTGIVFASAMLIGAIGQPWVGRLSDAKGRRGIFIVGSVIGVAAAIVCSPAAGSRLDFHKPGSGCRNSDRNSFKRTRARGRLCGTAGSDHAWICIRADGWRGCFWCDAGGGCRRLSTSLCVSARRRFLDHQHCSDFRRGSHPPPCLDCTNPDYLSQPSVGQSRGTNTDLGCRPL